MSDPARRSATTFRVSADAGSAEQELRRFQARIDKLNEQINRLNRQVERSNQSGLRFTRTLRGTTAGSNRLGNATSNASSAIAAFNGNIATAGGLLGGALGFGIAQSIERLISLGAQAESTRERFLALSESFVEGRQRYQEFADFADDRGLQFRGLLEAANQLRVVGFAGDNLDELITQIGITAGDSVERVERITRALGQMRAFGRVALEELNQLTEAGIPIITAIAQELNIPEGNVRGLIELGEIDFETVRNAFASLADESSAFFAASEVQSETLQASFNRLGNALFMFADVINERTSPALKGLTETTADAIDFFSTYNGQLIAISATLIGIAVPAWGTLLQVIARLSGPRTDDPILRRFRLMRVEFLRNTRSAGRLATSLRFVGLALRTAFSGPALGFTVAIAGAIALAVRRSERLREEARQLQEIFESAANTINELDTPDQFRLATEEISRLERELEGVNRLGEEQQEAWQAITNQIRDAEGDTSGLERTQAMFNDTLTRTSNRAAEIIGQINTLKIVLGELPEPQPLVEVTFPDETRAAIQRQTDALAEDILMRADEVGESLRRNIEFLPDQEQAQLSNAINQLNRLRDEVSDAAGEGLFFGPTGSTITSLNAQVNTLTMRLEELREEARRAGEPLRQLENILNQNVTTLLELEASSEVGILSEAERSRRVIEANERTLRDLLVLQRVFANTEGVTEETLERLSNAIADFRVRLPQQQSLENNLFDALFEETDQTNLLGRIEGVFSEVEIAVANRFREYLSNIARIRGVGDEEGLVSLFTPEESEDLSLAIQDQIRQETDRARLAAQQEFNTQFERDSFEFIQISYNQAQAVNDINEQQLRDYIRFGNSIGVYATDVADSLLSTGEIDEEEAFRLHNLIGEQTDLIEEEAERANRALDEGFRLEISPQIKAIANAVLTLGEALVSAAPAADNLFSLFEQGSGTFDDPRAGIIQTANALATFVSIAEQPFLAITDAIIAASDEYKAFLTFVRLSTADQEQFYAILPDDLADRARRIVADFQEVFSRVGTSFDADAFRLLPRFVQNALEEAFARYRQIPQTLEEVYQEAVEIIEAENITISERIRRVGDFLANNIGESAIQYGQSIVNIVEGIVTGASDASGILQELAGSLGEFLGLGRERVNTFTDAFGRFVTGVGNDAVILQERITQSIDAATIGTALNFNRLFTSVREIDSAFEQAAFTSIRLNESWREAAFVAGEFTGDIELLNEALHITELGLEDGALALAGLIESGGSLAGAIAPGVGLLAEAVNNVIDAAGDFVAVSRVIDTLPGWFTDGDIDILQRAFRELDAFTTLTREAQAQINLGFDVELPDLGILAEEAQQVLSVLTTLQPFITSDLFDEFLRARDFPDLFPDQDLNRGEQFLLLFRRIADGANLTGEQLEALRDVFPELAQAISEGVPDFFNQSLQQSIDTAREFSSTLSLLAQTITNNTRVQVQEMRFELEQLRRDRIESEQLVNEQLERETEGLRERLNAGLLSLDEYYREVDTAREEAEQTRSEAARQEIDLLNKIQQAEYEATINAFNINKATRLADIAINAAASFAATVGQTGIFGLPAAGIVAGLAAAQAALVIAQQPPPQPPPITALQTGGVVTGPTTALIGEAGPEAVIPLDEYEYNRRDEGNGTTIVINVQGSVIEERDLARTIYRANREAQRVRRVPSRSRR